MDKPLEVFCCYARQDQPYLLRLKKHLMALQREGLIIVQDDTDVRPGEDWKEKISHYLNTAQIILLLISPNFMASNYCYSEQMVRAMGRHEREEACVIPVILCPVPWQNAPFGKLEALPTEAKPVTDPGWHGQDNAFADVVQGIHRIIIPLLVKQYLAKGKTEYDQQSYRAALSAYEQVIIDLDPNCADAYLEKGKALEALKEWKEALAAYDQAICLEPNEAIYYGRKGQVLLDSYCYTEALEVLEQAIRLTPESKQLQIQRGDALQHLNRYEEALEAYNTAIHLDTKVDPQVYHNKGIILEHLAQQAHRTARQHGYTIKDQDSLQELSAILEKLSNEMMGKLEMSVLVKNILETVTRALGADASSLYLIEPGTRILSIQAATGYQSALVTQKAQYNLDEKGITPFIARTGQKVIARSRKELRQHSALWGKDKVDQAGHEPNAFLGIPLKALDATGTEQVIGVLGIEDIRSSSHQKLYFTDQDILLVEMMGNIIAIVIQNTRLNDIRLHELNEDLRALSGAMVGGLDMNVLVKRIVETIANVLGADASSLFLIGLRTRTLTIQAATGYQSALVTQKAQYNLDEKGITPFIACTGQKVIARSKEELRLHRAHKGKYNDAQEGHEPNAFLGIPLKVSVTGGGEETIGVLKVEDIRSNPGHPESYFTDQDVILVEMMGNIIATVIQNTRLNDIRLHELNEGLRALSGAIVGGLDMNVLVKRIVKTIGEVLRADASSLYLIEPGTGTLSIQAATGYQSALVTQKAQYNLDEKGITPFIARTGQKVIARSKEELRQHSAHRGKYNDAQEGHEPNAFLGIPLKISVTGGDEVTIGVLKVEDIRPNPGHPESYFTDQDVILVEMMGSVITTVIQNMRLAMTGGRS